MAGRADSEGRRTAVGRPATADTSADDGLAAVDGTAPADSRAGPSNSARTGRALVLASLTLLILVGVLAPSAAKPPLGPRGWAPGALPWAPASATITIGLAAAYVIGAVGVLLSLRDPRPVPRVLVATLAVGALLTMPFGSADHTNYAAYGRILLQGGDPWTASPIAWAGGHDPVTSGVQPPWQTTPSVYGPIAGLAQLLAAWLGGDNLRQVVWIWQWVVVATWLAGRWLLRRLIPDRPGLVDVLWTLNPLLFATAVLGAHVDLLATVCGVAALLLIRCSTARAWALAGVAAGTAIGIKVTAGVVLAAIVLAALARERERAAYGRLGALLAGAATVLIPAHLWAGWHTYDQLGRSRRSISLATPWRKAYEWSAGLLPDATLRTVVFAASALACVLLTLAVCRVANPPRRTPADLALLLTLALSFGYAAGATYSLPWYDQLVWALLPALPGPCRMPLARLQLARATVLGLGYVPGRVVGMSPAVESVTLGWRRDAAPAAAVAVWLVLLVWAVRPATRLSRPPPAR